MSVLLSLLPAPMRARMQKCLLLFVALVSLVMVGLRPASADPFVSTGLEAYPPNLKLKGGGAMMMLLASKDHTLFAPIYTDYEDLDGDGVLDNTFRSDFQYYGYFDSKKCYEYVAGYVAPNQQTGRFEPRRPTGADFKCLPATTGGTNSYWSGNFLNWATMTRIDVVRKLLYGGFRREDTATDTTLEMAQLSRDAHSFVKFYGGSDLSSYTPYSFTEGLTICNRGSINQDPTDEEPGQPVMRLAKGNYSLWATIPTAEVCRYANEGEAFNFGGKAGEFFRYYGTDINGASIPAGQAHGDSLPRSNESAFRRGGHELAVRVQACVTLASHPNAPTSESCASYGSGGSAVRKPVGLLQNYGTSASVDQAAKAEFGLITGSYDSPIDGGVLRKNVGALNDEIDPLTGRFCYIWQDTTADRRATSCKVSTTESYASKEAGIIATFDRIRLFDVGQYNNRSKSGNFVLPSQLRNGDFPSWGNPISEMYVQALSYLAGKPSGLTVSDPEHDDVVSLPRPAAVDPLDDTRLDRASGLSRAALYGHGICRKTLSLAISSSAVSYDSADSGSAVYGQFLSNFGKGHDEEKARFLAQWTDRIGALEYINESARSVGAADGGFGTDCTLKALGAGSLGLNSTYVGGLSLVSGVCPEAPAIKGSYLGAGAAFFARTTNLRADNELTANTGAGVDKDKLPLDALRVKSYAASLAGGVARIEVPIPGTNRFVVITPESLWDHDLASLMPGAMLTFRSIGKKKPNLSEGFGGEGSYVVTWNDTQFGGDYDMDLVGFIRWKLTKRAAGNNQWELAVQTDVLNHNATARGSHGFSIIGTDAKVRDSVYEEDGKFITHGSNGFNATGHCADLAVANSPLFDLYCSFNDSGAATTDGHDDYAWPTRYAGETVGFDDNSSSTYSTTVTTKFKVSSGLGTSIVTLREPLWYMAKYGAFDTGEKASATWASRHSTTAVPADLSFVGNKNYKNANWDSLKNNGSICAGSECGDGEPDGYFLARRPEQLASRLNDLLNSEVTKSNTAVSVSSAQLIDGSYKYVATFNDTGDMRYGNVDAYLLGDDGTFPSRPTWNFGSFLTAASTGANTTGALVRSRAVITDTAVTDAQGGVTKVGVPFTTSLVTSGQTAYSAPYLTAMAGGTSAAAQATAARMIAYMRGDRSGEGVYWRVRPEGNIMGQVINSTPWIQDPATSARFTDGFFAVGTPSYTSFITNRVGRNKVLWVGSNDGMLHGFSATAGTALLSYVPSPVVSRLVSAFTVSNGEAVPLVDGAPFTADVLNTSTENSAWRTYLFGNLGRGGKAVFALDVTDTGTATGASAGGGGLSESGAASVFKWVFTPDDDPDMGHVIATPVIHRSSGQAQQVVRLNNGRFALLVPNGFQSANGRPVLYILYTDGPGTTGWRNTGTSPNFYKFMPVESDANNGMAGVTWVDLNNDGTADVLYATDLRGQVWKVDIRSSNPADWGSAFKEGNTAVPFFTAKGCTGAGTAQNCDATVSITTSPVATLPKFGGVMLSMGTGRALSAGDFTSTTLTNRFISVWDRGRYTQDQVFPPPTNPPEGFVAPSLPSLSSDTGRARFAEILLRRDEREDGGTGSVYRVTRSTAGAESIVPTTTTDDVFNPVDQDGWFFNFPSSGEQLISSPSASAHFIAFTSVRPQSGSDQAKSCLTDPLGTFYILDPSNGLPVPGAFTTETINGVTFVVYGTNVSDQQIRVAGDRSTGSSNETNPSASCGPGRIKARYLGQVTDKDGCVAAANVRLQWRELNGMKTK